MRKKRQVPEVLWRLFRHRASTLAETVVSLLPPASPLPAECRCRGRRCLGCSGGDVMVFLLRPDDPQDYRKLMTQCYVVVSDKAPALSNFSAYSRWSQHEIVVRTIEQIICTQPVDCNVICSGYDKCIQSSPIVDLLTCPAWGLLLSRVRDGIMVYLLMHTSIFLPLPQKIHHQVTGLPISNLCIKVSNYSVDSPNRHDLSSMHGLQKKRKRVDNATSIMESDHPRGSYNNYCPLHSGCFSGCKRTYLPSSCCHHEDKLYQPRISDTTSQLDIVHTDTLERNSYRKLEKSNEFVALLGKRSRPFRWQRERKRRQLHPENYCNLTPCKSICSDKNSLCEKAPIQLSFQSCHSHKCSCFSTLQPPRKIAEGVYINRKSMFYNLDYSSSILLRGNVLHSLKPNFAGSESLARHIFGSSDAKGNAPSILFFSSSGTCPFASKCLYHSLIKLLKVLIRRTRNCQHVRLMDKHCSVPSLEQMSIGNSSSMFEVCNSMWEALEVYNIVEESIGLLRLMGSELDIESREDAHGFDIKQSKESLEMIDPQFAAKFYCPKSQVVSFIWAVCRSIIPADMLGTCSNWRILRRNISKFIQLRRFENFSLKQAMHKLKTSRFPFLSNKLSLCCQDDKASNSMHEDFSMLKEAASVMKQNLMENWIYWLFSYLIVPLIQANFYVTETEFGKQDVYFFQKSIWEKITKRAITSFKDKGYYHLNDSAVRNILANRSFGFSKLRLRPKENGVRILANLKAYSRMPTEEFYPEGGQSCGVHGRKEPIKFDHFKPVNCVLRDTHAVLKGIKLAEPELLGSSVFDYNDVYRKLRTFLLGLKKAKAAMPDLFLVVSDVSNAFDSVDQDKLLDVMKNIIVNEEYHLRQSHQILCTKKTLWVHENVMLINPNISPRFSSQFRSLHSVLVNQEQSRSVKKKELLATIYEHVKRNVMQFDKKFYLQGIGIPQGSVLSSLLCSLYFGDLERKVIFPFLERTSESRTKYLSGRQDCHDTSIFQSSSEDKITSNPGYMLLRFIDDFLFISASKQQAAYFLSRLQRGFRDYNCYMNGRKFGLNFSVGNTSGPVSNRVYVGEDGVSFLRWSGLLINCHSLEIQADYTRYLNNHLNSTLTVCWQGKPGHHLKAKLCDYLRPKCHPIFFDLNINTAAVLDSLPHPSLHLEDGEVEWLGLNAYIQALTRKQARHAQLLSLLKSKLLAHRLAGHISSDLIYAVDNSHSSLLWQIKY